MIKPANTANSKTAPTPIEAHCHHWSQNVIIETKLAVVFEPIYFYI
jgi:hypothetical protein